MNGFRVVLVLIGLCCCAGKAFPEESSGTNALARPVVEEIRPGVFRVGTVQLSKEERSITFPAKINMTNGPVEYLLVTGTGKLHESVFRAAVEPMHIHVAALLLGAKGAGTNLTVHDFNTKEIPGERAVLGYKLSGNGSKKVLVDDCVINTRTGKTMSRGPWIYNGSQVHGGDLVAQRDGLVISIMSDPLALLNNPRPGRESDDIWLVNSNAVGPLNMEVEFSIQFPPGVK